MSQANKTIVPEDVDLLVIGAGAGGMTTALIAALEGLRVVLCEKTGQAGGTTSTSGGTTWVPGNSLGAEIGAPDDARDAAAFLRHVTGDRDGEDLRQAFLASGRAAIDDLQNRSEVKFAASAAHPDYLDGPGSAWGGRALGPCPSMAGCWAMISPGCAHRAANSWGWAA